MLKNNETNALNVVSLTPLMKKTLKQLKARFKDGWIYFRDPSHSTEFTIRHGMFESDTRL